MSNTWNTEAGCIWTQDPNSSNLNGGQMATTNIATYVHEVGEPSSDNSGDFGDTNSQNNGASGACRNCGQEGHFARECPEPRKLGACFNCGKEGHSKAECTEPRVFRGTCNICSQEGHPASRCPQKPKTCARCKVEGDHDTKDCKNNFYIDLKDVPDVPESVAWGKMVEASQSQDMDDFKDAMRMLQKAAPEITYPAIEKKLRAQNMHFYLIALKKDVGDGFTMVNLQGEPEKSFIVAIHVSPKCKRPIMVDMWPKTPEENLARLADAGIVLQRGLPYCRNCSTYGHIARECDQEKTTFEGPTVLCVHCGETGHRVRDCKEPRNKPRERGARECRVCGSTEHIAKDCDQKPAMKCRNCDQEGHKASECTEPRKLMCLNCDEEGHLRKDCPKPMIWEKVTCRHCGEKGHLSANRCAPGAAKKQDEGFDNNNNSQKANSVAEDGFNTGSNDNAGTTNGAAGDGWNTGSNGHTITASGADDGWNTGSNGHAATANGGNDGGWNTESNGHATEASNWDTSANNNATTVW